MGRKARPKRKDQKMFRRTAAKSKKINITPVIYRGGIRL
uniref:DNA binding protein n=1 Tax=Dulem virus 109 TaxID=3145586 RepID=A0AAU8B1G3_9VIRU